MNDPEIFIHYWQRFCEHPVIKIAAGFFLWLLKLMFGAVFRPAYGMIFILWLLDTLSGYYYAWANPKLIPESRRMYHGLVKLTVYYILLLVGYQISRCGTNLTTLIQTMIEVAIGLTELKSILENIDKIAKLKGAEIPLLKRIVAVIQGKIAEIGGGKTDD